MKELAGIRAKIWAYLVDDGSEKKKAKRNKKMHNKKRTYAGKLYRLLVQ